MEYRPMPASVFFALNVGDKVHIQWCKDNNPEYERLSKHTVQTIGNKVNGTVFLANPGFSFDLEDAVAPESNAVDCGRGNAYLYYP